MAGYRQIHTKIWKDEWFIELSKDEKLLFIYLFSNDEASISGLYKLPVRVMVNETGIEHQDIEQSLARFERDGRVYYGDGVIWVVHMSRYHHNSSALTQKKRDADIARIGDCEVKKRYLWDIQHPNIPYRYPIDTPSRSADKSESETQAQSETKTQSVGANAPPAGNVPSTNGKTDKSPAVLLYHSTVKLWPNSTQEAAINRVVKDLAKWQLVVDAWRMRGIKPTNVDCLIDWYEKGIPEGKPNGTRPTEPPQPTLGNRQPPTAARPRR